MNKTKTYRHGKTTARAYLRNAGNGWEVGFTYGGKPLFVGNFIHTREANLWYGLLNREIRGFNRRYKVGPRFPHATYTKFLSSHLYNRYYALLDRLFAKYTRNFNRAVVRNLRSYKLASRRTNHVGPRTTFLKAA